MSTPPRSRRIGPDHIPFPWPFGRCRSRRTRSIQTRSLWRSPCRFPARGVHPNRTLQSASIRGRHWRTAAEGRAMSTAAEERSSRRTPDRFVAYLSLGRMRAAGNCRESPSCRTARLRCTLPQPGGAFACGLRRRATGPKALELGPRRRRLARRWCSRAEAVHKVFAAVNGASDCRCGLSLSRLSELVRLWAGVVFLCEWRFAKKNHLTQIT